ncbi:DedA family protein, partial [Desulfovibrio sp. OttesenSCG-928-A18]|nr:DedA family protein [Desulfovibrio sp. OttesenSCG-928-A18]
MFEHSSAGQLLARYGYLAILVGTMLEGETVVLVAGVLAHEGYLSLPWIVVFAIIGSSISDQGLFFLARLKGMKLLSRFPRASARVNAMAERMRSRPVALGSFALFFRFLYGFRNVAPIFLGMSSIPALRFVLLNAIGAVFWALAFSLAGYSFALLLTSIMGTLARFEVIVLLLIILSAGSLMAWR